VSHNAYGRCGLGLIGPRIRSGIEGAPSRAHRTDVTTPRTDVTTYLYIYLCIYPEEEATKKKDFKLTVGDSAVQYLYEEFPFAERSC